MEDNKGSLRDVSSNWIHNILNSLLTLEECDHRMKDGCSDLTEYINTLSFRDHEDILGKVKLKNMELMISRFELIFSDIKAVIEKKEMEDLLMRHKVIKDYAAGKIVIPKDKRVEGGETHYKVARMIINQVRKTNRIVLTKHFETVASSLSQLREQLNLALSHILFVKESINITKGKER